MSPHIPVTEIHFYDIGTRNKILKNYKITKIYEFYSIILTDIFIDKWRNDVRKYKVYALLKIYISNDCWFEYSICVPLVYIPTPWKNKVQNYLSGIRKDFVEKFLK